MLPIGKREQGLNPYTGYLRRSYARTNGTQYRHAA